MRAAIIVMGLCLAACWKPHPPDPREPEEPLSAGGGSPASCEDVCGHADDLGCDWAKETPEGATCAEVCDNVQRSGILRWNLNCRKRASSCDAMEECE